MKLRLKTSGVELQGNQFNTHAIPERYAMRDPRNEREAAAALAAWPDTQPAFRHVIGAADIEARARKLYELGGNRAAAPAWEQLGDVTKSVWHDRAEDELRANPTNAWL